MALLKLHIMIIAILIRLNVLNFWTFKNVNIIGENISHKFKITIKHSENGKSSGGTN